MTLDENLQLLRTTKQNIKTALNDKMPESADNKPFGEYHSIVDGFKQGSNNIEDYTITNSTRLSEYTGDSFTLLPHIKSVNIPTTVTSLGEHCFRYYSSLTSITIPDSVISIGGNCFGSCSSLTGITIPDSVTSLGNSCFYSCISLSTIVIGNSVTSLGQSCFESCSSLTSVTIPDSVTSISYWCFSKCSSLAYVTCKATTPPTLEDYAFSRCSSLSAIYVPAESVDAYKTATNWGGYASKIQAIAS